MLLEWRTDLFCAAGSFKGFRGCSFACNSPTKPSWTAQCLRMISHES